MEDRRLLSVDLIRNGGFGGVVSPTDWATTGSFHADSRFTNCHNSPGYADLSNADGTAGNNLIGEMFSSLTIPSNATSTILSYWYSITTQDTSSTAHDFLNVTVRNASGVDLRSPDSTRLNDTTGYQEATYDLTAFHGHTVTLDFLGNYQQRQSSHGVPHLDDVSAIATTTPHISRASILLNPLSIPRNSGSASAQTLFPVRPSQSMPAVRRTLFRRTARSIAARRKSTFRRTHSRREMMVGYRNGTGRSLEQPIHLLRNPAGRATADLAASMLSVNPTGVGAGGQATVTFTVANSGNASAPSTVATIRLGSVTTVTDQESGCWPT